MDPTVRSGTNFQLCYQYVLTISHKENDLTEREREILALMIEGLNNTQIAGKLTVSSSTVKSHVSNILSKLGVASRTEAVTLALRNRIIS
jgi:two-component system, NarL family, response regulator LiaR